MTKSVVIKIKDVNTGKLEQVDKAIDRWSNGCNFAVKKRHVLLSGLRKGSWVYNYLINKLEERGKTEGFKVIRMTSAYLSLVCPKCKTDNQVPRKNMKFTCTNCGNSTGVLSALLDAVSDLMEREAPAPLQGTSPVVQDGFIAEPNKNERS